MFYFLAACQVKPQSQPSHQNMFCQIIFSSYHSQTISCPSHSAMIHRACCHILLGNTSYSNKQAYLFWSSTTVRYEPNYNQHFPDFRKLSSIHRTFLILMRKHLYQPSSPVSWFQQFPLAAASQNKVSSLKLQNTRKTQKRRVSSFLCSAETARSDTVGWRDQEKQKAPRIAEPSSSVVVNQRGARLPKVLFSASPLWKQLCINSFLIQEASKGYAYPFVSLLMENNRDITYTSVWHRATSNLCRSQQCCNMLKVCVFSVLSTDKKKTPMFLNAC